MAVEREYSIVIKKQESILNNSLAISKSDNGVDIYFRLLGSQYFDINKHKYMYSTVSICNKYSVLHESNITPIVNNKILFRIKADIVNILEIGQYDIYIRLLDEKGQQMVLPSFKMSVENTMIGTLNIEEGQIEIGYIDNVNVQTLGNDLDYFLPDESYNVTVWSNGDLISANKMNKIEGTLNELVDVSLEYRKKILELERLKGYNFRLGSINNPVILSDLQKGNYIVNGYVKDFENSASREVNEAKYYVVYKDEDNTNILVNEDTSVPTLINYNTNLLITNRIYDDIRVLQVIDNKVYLTNDKYQFITSNVNFEIILPTNISLSEIHLFILPTADINVTYPNVSWRNYPNIKNGITNETIFNYYNKWYGYNVTYDVNITQSEATKKFTSIV